MNKCEYNKGWVCVCQEGNLRLKRGEDKQFYDVNFDRGGVSQRFTPQKR